MFHSLSEECLCIFSVPTLKKFDSDVYSGALAERIAKPVLLKASTKLLLSRLQTSNGFEAGTERMLGLQTASWKFAADCSSSEIKNAFYILSFVFVSRRVTRAQP